MDGILDEWISRWIDRWRIKINGRIDGKWINKHMRGWRMGKEETWVSGRIAGWMQHTQMHGRTNRQEDKRMGR